MAEEAKGLSNEEAQKVCTEPDPSTKVSSTRISRCNQYNLQVCVKNKKPGGLIRKLLILLVLGYSEHTPNDYNGLVFKSVNSTVLGHSKPPPPPPPPKKLRPAAVVLTTEGAYRGWDVEGGLSQPVHLQRGGDSPQLDPQQP